MGFITLCSRLWGRVMLDFYLYFTFFTYFGILVLTDNTVFHFKFISNFSIVNLYFTEASYLLMNSVQNVFFPHKVPIEWFQNYIFQIIFWHSYCFNFHSSSFSACRSLYIRIFYGTAQYFWFPLLSYYVSVIFLL